jgi:hypothetical protein
MSRDELSTRAVCRQQQSLNISSEKNHQRSNFKLKLLKTRRRCERNHFRK